MAKELEIKIKIDGQEIDVAKKSTKELTEQISGLRTKLSEVPIGSAEFKKIQGDIDTLEKGFTKAKNATQPFLESMSQLPGVAGLAGQSLKGVKGAFDLLAENPLIAVFSLLAMIILKVVDKMKDLEGVMDPLEKISAQFSGVMSALANLILPPIAALLETIADGASKVANFFGSLIGQSEKMGDNMAYVAETMDNLNDTNAEFAVSQAAANRQLQEAREIAGDATKSVAVRVQALRDAEKIERDIAEKARARQVLEAQAKAVELALSLGYNDEQIAAIKNYDATKLASFVKEIQGMKGLNREKSNALFANLGNIEESAAQEAKIAKKTESQIRSVEREGATKAKEEAKAAAEEKKDFEKRLNDFKADIRLLGIKDEQEKARISLENDKKKTLEEIETLKMSTKRKAELRKAAEEDFAAKAKTLTEKQEQETADKIRAFQDKVEALEIGGYKKELDRQLASIDMKARQDKIAISKDAEFKKKSAEEQARILALIDKKAITDKEKANEDAAKKDADLLYKRIEFERQSRLQGFQNRLKEIDLEFKSEQDKALERKKILDAQAKEDFDKEIENLKKLLNTKEITQAEYDDRAFTQRKTFDLKVKENDIKTTEDVTKAKMAEIAAYGQLGTAIGAVADAMGVETDAGKALKLASQGLILVSQTLTFVRQVQALTTMAAAEAEGVLKGASLPFPGNLLAIATTVATFASIIVSVKGLIDMAKGGGGAAATTGGGRSGIESSKGYGEGGLLEGPRHAAGGMMVNAEGGEAIMTRGAVTMFGPLLSQLNQAGGGTSFAKGISGSANYDNPKSPSNASLEPTIIKTYVVAQDMNTMNHKQARLKDLSTL